MEYPIWQNKEVKEEELVNKLRMLRFTSISLLLIMLKLFVLLMVVLTY